MQGTLAIALLVAFAGCGPAAYGGSGSGGASGGHGGSSGSGGSDSGIDNSPDAINCGVQNFDLQRGLPPDVLVVLDGSDSMSSPPTDGGAAKWTQVTGA